MWVLIFILYIIIIGGRKTFEEKYINKDIMFYLCEMLDIY